MNPTKTTAKDFFLNLGVIVALYTVVISLLNLLFTVINNAYPQISNGYNYYGSQSISWPAAILIIFFPIFILLSWLLEKGFSSEPEKRNLPVRKWLSYITLFVAGIVVAVDLVTVLYKFLDGQDLTTAFFLKVLAVLVVSSAVFTYFLTEIRDKMTSGLRKIWLAISVIIILVSVIWGFSVLGTPATQRLYKYDSAKINDLMTISSAVQMYYYTNSSLPKDFAQLKTLNYDLNTTDTQNQKSYEYIIKSNRTFELCAEFNKASSDNLSTAYPLGGSTWSHPEGRHCFTQTVEANAKQIPVR